MSDEHMNDERMSVEEARRIAEQHNVRYPLRAPWGEWEGTVFRGVVRAVVFSDYIGKFVVLLSPGGFATIAPENAKYFADGDKKLGDCVGERWLGVYAEDGDVWTWSTVWPWPFERLSLWLEDRGWRGRGKRYREELQADARRAYFRACSRSCTASSATRVA